MSRLPDPLVASLKPYWVYARILVRDADWEGMTWKLLGIGKLLVGSWVPLGISTLFLGYCRLSYGRLLAMNLLSIGSLDSVFGQVDTSTMLFVAWVTPV